MRNIVAAIYPQTDYQNRTGQDDEHYNESGNNGAGDEGRLALSYGLARSAIYSAFITGTIVTALIIVFIILAGLILVVGLWIYRRNYILITNKHLIQVEQSVSSAARSTRSASAASRMSLLSPVSSTLLGYGTVSSSQLASRSSLSSTASPIPASWPTIVSPFMSSSVKDIRHGAAD